MADLFFFTDIDLITAQTDEEKYGPISSFYNVIDDTTTVIDPQTKYRVCSLHSFTASSHPKAYSVCKGLIRIQPIDGGELVNIILKPEDKTVFKGLKIRYFIYRGIRRDSVLNGSELAVPSTSELLNSIWEKHQVMVQNTAETQNPIIGNPSEDILGMDLQSLPDTSLIDELFLQNNDYIIPDIDAGKSLGFFNSGKGGFEIVLENYFSDDTLQSVRKLDHYIDADLFTNNYENKCLREKILSYIDPCAFYGYFFDDGITCYYSSGTSSTLTGAGVYLTLLSEAFVNCNKIYIDIRNENNLSYSYYSSDYNNEILNFLIDGTESENRTYNTNFWPLHIFTSPSDYTTYINNTTRLKFGISKHSFQKKPVLLFSRIQTNSSGIQTNSFFIDENRRFKAGTFISVEDNKVALNKLEIILYSLASSSSPSQRRIVSNYLKLDVFYTENDILDPTFGNAILPIESKSYKNVFVYPGELPSVPTGKVMIKKLFHYSLLSYYVDDRIAPSDNIVDSRTYQGIFESYIAVENNRIFFLAIPTIHKYYTVGDFFVPSSITEGLQSSFSFLTNFEQQNIKNIELGKHELKIGSTKIPFLNFMQIFDKKAGVSKPVIMLCLGVVNSEYETLKNLVTNNQLKADYHPVFLFLKNLSIQIDANNIAYKTSEMSLGGIAQSGSAINETSVANINLYTTDSVFSSVLFANLENKQITPFKKMSTGGLKVELTKGLQDALSILSIEKQQLFTALFKLQSFNKYAKEIAAATGTTNIIFKHEPPESSSALADAHAKYTLLGGKVTKITIIIRIRPSYLVKGSPLSILATILHEMMHAIIDFEMLNLVGKTSSLTKEEITKLRNHTRGIIYADFYCKFGIGDKVIPSTGNNINERSFSHNYMAEYLRSDIENGLITYEKDNEILRDDVNILLRDVFSNSDVPFTITKSKVYQGTSWGGLFHTRSFRKNAGEDDNSKLLFQVYLIISNHEANSFIYPVPPNVTLSGYDEKDFLPVNTPTTPIC